MELEFHGAAQTVTGSMHVLHLNGNSFAMDCGLFQGHREEARERNVSFPMAPEKLSGVLLSHAHIDHSGNIPGLVRHGFRGPVYATPATCDLSEVMLLDSAHIQEEDARFWNEKRASRQADYVSPLYTVRDARSSVKYFHAVPYGRSTPFGPKASVTFLEAGHILGSAMMLVEIERERTIRVLYTGDLGRFRMPILRDPADPLPPVDYLITECTYADRRHAESDGLQQRLATIINETRAAGGKVIIPSFSVGRTQNVVYYLARAIDEGLMEPLPIYVDSPLSVNATEIFKRHPECYDEDARKFYAQKGDLFGDHVVRYITDVENSKRLNHMNKPMVIVASAGMCEAGRILHHLKNNVENEANTVVIVGFMAQHTLGRRIVERREEIKIFGRMYKLLCRVETLNGFSAHADANDFVYSFGPIARGLKAAFCVHGEGSQPAAMQEILSRLGCPHVHVPSPGQRFALD